LNIVETDSDIISAFYSPLTRSWELLCGGLLAWVSVHEQPGTTAIRNRLGSRLRVTTEAMSVTGFLLLLCSVIVINDARPFPGVWAVMPVAGAMLVIAAGPTAILNRTLLSWRVAVWFGLISYPLYLWHWPILSFWRLLSIDNPAPSALAALLVLSVVLSWATWTFIEKPVRFGTSPNTSTGWLLALMAVAGIVGFTTSQNNGYGFRRAASKDTFFSQSARQAEQALVDEFTTYAGDDPSTSTKPLVLLLGDSYVKNWSAAASKHLDRNRFDIASASYLGCSVTISDTKISATPESDRFKEFCDPFESIINNPQIANRIAAVFLVSHRPFEYRLNSFRFDVIRWLQRDRQPFDVFVFGNYFQLNEPRFFSCEKLMMKARRGPDVCLEYADYPRGQPEVKSLPFYPKDMELQYVDIISLHCSYTKSGCSTQAGGIPFMSDWAHLNAGFIDHLFTQFKTERRRELTALGLDRYLVSQ